MTGKINLDYALVHIDRNELKFFAAKQKYGDRLVIHDPGHIGAVMLSYEGTDRTVWDIIREFGIFSLDDYFAECRAHKAVYGKRPV